MKPSEHAPASASFFAELALEAGVPDGVLNVVHGLGDEAGAPLVAHPDVDLVSFTGSAATGRSINEAAARRLAKTCLELGGKNALVVCDDADLDDAVRWALASAFSNAGQRCASASRIVVLGRGLRRRFGSGSSEARRRVESQPVISRESMERILEAVARAREAGAVVLTGGERLDRPGWHVAPTVIEGAAPDDEISRVELFGPVTVLYRVATLEEAIALVNDSPYGLTAAIHTASVHRAHALRRARPGRRRRRERGHARLGAAHGLRRRQGLGDRVEGGRDRVARRVFRSEGRQPRRRSREDMNDTAAVLGPAPSAARSPSGSRMPACT